MAEHDETKRPHRRKARPKWRVKLDPVQYWGDKLLQVEEAIEDLAGNNSTAPNKYTALAALYKSAEKLRQLYDRALAEAPEQDFETEAEAIAAIELEVKDWPDSYCEAVLRLYGARHRGTIRMVGEAGHISEMTDKGWKRLGKV